MPIYDHTGRRQVCSKCGWKNPMVEHTDCLMFYHQECPECKGKLEFKKVSVLESKIETLIKYLKK